MMKGISAIFYIVFSFILIINEINATENKILIKINNEIITSLDIASEVKYLKAINKDYSKEEKLSLIKYLWDVAYADNILEVSEERLIRRIADLIKIKDVDVLKLKDISKNHKTNNL